MAAAEMVGSSRMTQIATAVRILSGTLIELHSAEPALFHGDVLIAASAYGVALSSPRSPTGA